MNGGGNGTGQTAWASEKASHERFQRQLGNALGESVTSLQLPIRRRHNRMRHRRPRSAWTPKLHHDPRSADIPTCIGVAAMTLPRRDPRPRGPKPEPRTEDYLRNLFTFKWTTQAQLLQKATEIDATFGSQFLPPVGGE